MSPCSLQRAYRFLDFRTFMSLQYFMNDNERNRFVALHVFLANILLALTFWEIASLPRMTGAIYYFLKFLGIGSYYLLSFLIYKEKLKPSRAFNISCVVFFLYSYASVITINPLYILAFYGGFVLFSLFYTDTLKRYLLNTFFGFALAFLSIKTMARPEFIEAGYEIDGPLLGITFVFFVLSLITFWLVNRQREIIFQKDQKFAVLGRQSAFLLHELKSPLSRFLSRAEGNNRDADNILSIIEGVELLVTRRENLHLGKLDWSYVGNSLQEEFRPVCDIYKIKLELSGFEGEGQGHRSTILLALKNLIKNAVEAIAASGEEGAIRVNRSGNTIEVSNNGSVISKDQLAQLFKPFVSGKKTNTNYGIGLHFVESVVKAHNGEIVVTSESGWNVFTIKLGGIV